MCPEGAREKVRTVSAGVGQKGSHSASPSRFGNLDQASHMVCREDLRV